MASLGHQVTQFSTEKIVLHGGLYDVIFRAIMTVDFARGYSLTKGLDPHTITTFGGYTIRNRRLGVHRSDVQRDRHDY